MSLSGRGEKDIIGDKTENGDWCAKTENGDVGGRHKRDWHLGVMEAEDSEVEESTGGTERQEKKIQKKCRREGAGRLEVGLWEGTTLYLLNCGLRT